MRSRSILAQLLVTTALTACIGCSLVGGPRVWIEETETHQLALSGLTDLTVRSHNGRIEFQGRDGISEGVVNVTKAPAKDNEWFTQTIIVKGKQIIIKVNGKTLVDYTEPDDKKPGNGFARVLDKGTFALQAHDPKSKVHFKNLRVRRLK